MAVQEIMKALHGNYEPTGVYSFEFRKVGGDIITEIFMLLPPESITVSEPQRSEIVPTLGGGYIVDFGNEYKEISISGQSHFFYVGSTRKPASQLGRSFEILPENLIDGFSEFIKLRYLISRYRDYTLTPDSRVISPDFSLRDLASVEALKTFVKGAVEDGDGALIDQIELLWHDYDADDHFKVKVERFSMSRNKDDPHTITYDLSLIAYEVDTPKTDSGSFLVTFLKKISPSEKIRRAFLLMGDVMPASDPEELQLTAASGTISISNQRSVDKEPPLAAVPVG